MKTLYLECSSGIAGDMTAAALLDAGGDEAGLRAALASLPLDGYELLVRRVNKSGIQACLFDVILHEEEHARHDGEDHVHHHHHGRGLREIEAVVAAGALTDRAKSTALSIFRVLAEVEGAVHGVPPEEVHFHEVGAVDSIVDAVSAAYLIDQLGIERVVASPLREGTGQVRCAHGLMPVPAPAVAELCRRASIPLVITAARGEMVTPTGAAIVAAMARSFEPPVLRRVSAIGVGAGHKDFEHANILRAFIFESDEHFADEVAELVTCVDDSTPEQLGYLMERLLKGGALDAYYAPVTMKKSRPAVELTVLCREDARDALIHTIFEHSGAIGLRERRTPRAVMERRADSVATPYGEIAVKRLRYADIEKTTVEYESAKAAAAASGVPLESVYRAALEAARG